MTLISLIIAFSALKTSNSIGTPHIYNTLAVIYSKKDILPLGFERV